MNVWTISFTHKYLGSHIDMKYIYWKYWFVFDSRNPEIQKSRVPSPESFIIRNNE